MTAGGASSVPRQRDLFEPPSDVSPETDLFLRVLHASVLQGLLRTTIGPDGRPRVELCGGLHRAPDPRGEGAALAEVPKDPPRRFFEAWQAGRAGVPFGACLAGDLYQAFRAWCVQSGLPPETQTAFGARISGELAAMGAPPKRVVRVVGWSRAVIDAGEFDSDLERLRGVVVATTAKVDGSLDDHVQAFQRALHALQRRSRQGTRR